ncbi:hypothetical protein AWZ03_002363 [Drosophila navojoa]|uniref:Gamma-tubulin complex component n=2 Tax=Drosophila navojoa TaxID=7232 RepID=A0A484BR12_DRONA|nr:hypothetical protein AWZ03_002363 [Drosophila navojoa]
MRNAHKNQIKSSLKSSILKDSMARMNESKGGTSRVKINLPLRDKDEPPLSESLAEKDSSTDVTLEKHFVSDLLLSNELAWHMDKTLKLTFIKLPLLIEHLKQAAAGLQSDTIVCTAEGNFMMKPHITLDIVLPELLAEYADPFLVSGRAYRRLSARTQCQYESIRNERPLNRALRQAIINFITNSRLFLLSIPAENLGQLLSGAGPTMELIKQMAQLFELEQICDTEGIDGMCAMNLMSFVWSFINGGIDCTFSQLLMYLLSSLCETYFSQLKRWIYQGELDEPFNELFINSCTHKLMHERSKEYFDKAYYIRSDLVPGFLVGCEQPILQCGKYNRFLKTYNAQHPIFSLKYPNLVLCLSEQHLLKIRQELELHYDHIRQKIKPFKMQTILEDHIENSQRYGNRMWDCTQSFIATWKQELLDLQIEADIKKKRRYEELNEQREQQEQVRLEQQRSELILELEYYEKSNKIEEQRLQQKKKELEEKVAALKQKMTASLASAEVASPDDSTSSSRSFVSCEEPDIEIVADKRETAEMAQPNSVDLAETNPVEVAEPDPVDVSGPKSDEEEPNLADVLNSNETDKSLARNRMRNNSSEQFQECQMKVQLHQIAHTSAASYTDAELNRLRVLNCTGQQLGTKLPPDMNMNIEDLTDLQRNRLRMHQHNNFSSLNHEDELNSDSEKRLLHSDTELARNRRRVMEGDFTISGGLGNTLHLPLQSQDPRVESTLDIGTPMSITSDVEIDVQIPNEVIDATNNNNTNSRIVINDQEEIEEAPVVTEPAPRILPVPKEKSVFSLPITRSDREQSHAASPMEKIGHNPFLVKRYMQLSVLLPVKMHLSLLRNEVLRIFHEQRIFDYFCDLRKYFFLLDGEFGTVLIGEILGRIESGSVPHSMCQKGVLDSILNNALANRAIEGSESAIVADNLALNCTTIPESFDLMDINALSIFQLECKVEWPLNLVLSVETMEKYRQIFSHLMKLRHISFIMERTYQDFQQSSRLYGRRLQQSPQYRHLQMIRHKLSHFVFTLQNHIVTNALEGTWKTFTDDLIAVGSVEELYQRHVDYLKEIAFFSLLNRRSVKFRETIDSILVIALRFCKILNSKSFVLDEGNQFVHPRYKRLVFEETEFEKFIRYAIYLGNKVAASGYQAKIIDLIRIINYNNYYKVSSKN